MAQLINNLEDNLLIDLAFDGDLQVTKTGDLQQIRGEANLKQALFHRLITVAGSLVHRPEYGVGVKEFQNAISSLENQRDLALRIQQQFTRDERVDSVTGVSFTPDEADPSKFLVLVKYEAVAFGEVVDTFDPFEVQA